ncbi:MAG: MBL fold metallo-hydrolase [Ignavibacteriales bacterium]|nr:MBL fold metallo-hydrolase [Ignavibacteriales bacterium]
MKYFLFVVLFIFLFTFSLLAQELTIYHLNVGQADATLIKSPTGVTMLIDGGNTGNGTGIILPYLSSLGITSLNYVVCSHYHADHLGGLDEVINGLGAANIGTVYDRGSDAPLPTTVAFTDYVTAATAAGRVKVTLGQTVDLGGGVTMQCLATDGEVYNYGVVPNSTGSENDLSVGWKLNYGSFQYFTGGDLGGEVSTYADNETPLAPQVGNVDAFKINHHGSQYSTNQVFVNTLQAEVGIISVGTNTYGHPTQEVINRLDVANCYIYQTATGSGGTIPAGAGVVANNHVILRTSGTSYTVSYGTTTHNYTGDGGAPDVTPPVISAVTASSITSSSAVITWTTDEASNSVVEYGLTTSYGSTVTNATMVTSHSVSLSGLTASTLYHYRVKSTDAANNTATSTDYTFTTSAPVPVSTLIESFSDGNFTTNPTWGGNTTAFQVVTSSDVGAGATNSYTLRLNYTTASAGTRYLRTQRTASWGTSQSWSFWIGRRAQAATTANQSIVWLWANGTNLTASTIDGYRIKFGDDTGDDNIVLQSVTNNVATDIITSSGTVLNGLTDIGFMVRVTRTSGSVWTLYTSTLPTTIGSGAIATDVPTAANTSINQGSVTNSTYTNFANGYFGFVAVHSSGASARIAAEFDQLYFDTTSTSPLGKSAFSPEFAYAPSTFRLNQNYPNPFNPSTTLSFDLAEDAVVTLKVYDVIGREVGVIVNNEDRSAGTHQMRFDGSTLASGVYYCKLNASTITGKSFADTKRLVLLK